MKVSYQMDLEVSFVLSTDFSAMTCYTNLLDKPTEKKIRAGAEIIFSM